VAAAYVQVVNELAGFAECERGTALPRRARFNNATDVLADVQRSHNCRGNVTCVDVQRVWKYE